MIAIPLIFRRLTADDCADEVAADSRINALRAKLNVIENKKLTNAFSSVKPFSCTESSLNY